MNIATHPDPIAGSVWKRPRGLNRYVKRSNGVYVWYSYFESGGGREFCMTLNAWRKWATGAKPVKLALL